MEMVSNPSSIAIAHRFCNYLKVPTYLQDSPPLVIVSAQPQSATARSTRTRFGC